MSPNLNIDSVYRAAPDNAKARTRLAKMGKLSDNMPDMKKVTSREFQKAFSKVSQRLKPGEAVEVTRHGKAIGRYTKAPARGFELPNFLENLKKLGHSPEVGESILKRFHDSIY